MFAADDPRTYSSKARPADFLEQVVGVFNDFAGPLFETPTDRRQGRQIQNLLVHMAALRDGNERLRLALARALAILRDRVSLTDAEAESLEALLQPPLEVIEPVKQPTVSELADRLRQVHDDPPEDEPH